MINMGAKAPDFFNSLLNVITFREQATRLFAEINV